MTSTLERSSAQLMSGRADDDQREVLDRGSTPSSGSGDSPIGRRAQVTEWLRGKKSSLIWFAPVFVLTALVQWINMGGSPQRIDDEGTYTAQAFAVERFSELSHYTFWYDHPPLGWIQIAGWTQLTGAFSRYDTAVLAGREAMLVAHLVSVVLLWMLARRLRLSRPASAAAVAIYALSPLAVQFHRSVFLDNVATPWLLAAFVLALAPRRQLLAFTGAGVCFSIAVLSKETFLLMLPFLAWQMWRGADRGTRRYTLSLAAATVVLLGLAYVLFSVIKGELLPGANRVSLFDGVGFQLFGRGASGSLFDASSQARVTTSQWLQLDPVIAVVAPLAAILALRERRLWPVATALLSLVAFMFRPGYLPIPYVIALLPFAALLIPAAVEVALRRARAKVSVRRRRAGVVTAVLAAMLATAVAAPMWAVQLRGLLLADLDQPMREAQTWVEQNVDRDYRIVVDDAMWVDMVDAGFPRENVVWYYKVDTDPAVADLAPNGWQDYDYVISTNSLRTFPDGFPIVAEALDNSVVVATFGQGDTQVTVHRVMRGGSDAAQQQEQLDRAARSAAGRALVDNPALDIAPGVEDLMTGGLVDARALTVLPEAASVGDLTIADVPALPGEESLEQPRRALLISEIDGVPVSQAGAATEEVADFLAEQPAPYNPKSVQRTAGGLLVTYSIGSPAGLLTAPSP
jgi:4-amino-4-deoxy-L-arabinose transferase-like glycosyltransferase